VGTTLHRVSATSQFIDQCQEIWENSWRLTDETCMHWRRRRERSYSYSYSYVRVVLLIPSQRKRQASEVTQQGNKPTAEPLAKWPCLPVLSVDEWRHSRSGYHRRVRHIFSTSKLYFSFIINQLIILSVMVYQTSEHGTYLRVGTWPPTSCLVAVLFDSRLLKFILCHIDYSKHVWHYLKY